MKRPVHPGKYRFDIDGLRAIAVLAVIAFHFGYLPNGYLGVDVFFVISGFLITGIIYDQMMGDGFSLMRFYIRRTRRIIPLTIFVSLIALLVGAGTMLPDDMENLAQSVVATLFFSNNILQAITTQNYWDVANEYKPLMHTWSLGVEEQYYLLYPFIFVLVGKKRVAWLLPILAIIGAISFGLCLMPFQEFKEFYYIVFRFWELAAGGVAAIMLGKRQLIHRYTLLPIILLATLFFVPIDSIEREWLLLATVLLTTAALESANDRDRLTAFVLQNQLAVAIGKISFSLYMWHQPILAFSRYLWVQELRSSHLALVLLFTVAFSLASYWLVEQPFRNRRIVSTQRLLVTLAIAFCITGGSAWSVYYQGGVLRDIPELDIRRGEAGAGVHAKYNSRVHEYDIEFSSKDKLKVLVVGNSFARDWVNVLLESRFAADLELSYVSDPYSHKSLSRRAQAANIVFVSTPSRDAVESLEIPVEKLWAVGTKNFGASNGVFYNYQGSDYYEQRTRMESRYLGENEMMDSEWGDRYLNLVEKVLANDNTVPIFTPSRHFISQDCRHFTKSGAQYFASLFEQDLAPIFAESSCAAAADR